MRAAVAAPGTCLSTKVHHVCAPVLTQTLGWRQGTSQCSEPPCPSLSSHIFTVPGLWMLQFVAWQHHKPSLGDATGHHLQSTFTQDIITYSMEISVYCRNVTLSHPHLQHVHQQCFSPNTHFWNVPSGTAHSILHILCVGTFHISHRTPAMSCAGPIVSL